MTQPRNPFGPSAAPPPARAAWRGGGVLLPILLATLLVALVLIKTFLVDGSAAGHGPAAGGDRRHPAPATSTAGRRSTTATPVVDRPPYAGDLRDLLVPAPRDAQPWAVPRGADGTLSADQVAAETGDPAAALALLRRYGFHGAAVRTWTQPDRTVVEVRILQFDSAAHAAGYTATAQAATRAAWGRAATLPTPGVAGGETYFAAQPDQYGYVYLAAFAARNDLVLHVNVNQPEPGDPAAVNDLVLRQYQRLP
ncbi:MAG: hypothetical protein ACJ73S_18735 [Mycobacteriales bacterium]